MDKNAVGFLAAIFLWRGYLRSDQLDVLIDGAYLLAEAIGTGHEELAEAIRIANKYRYALHQHATWKNLTRREVFQEAVKMVEDELGITIRMPKGGDRWKA